MLNSMQDMFSSLKPKKIYTYQELLEILQSTKKRSVSSCRQTIETAIKNGSLIRAMRGQYMLCDKVYPLYVYSLTAVGVKLQRLIKKAYPDIDFVIFELAQLNEFLNHQIGRNIIFIYVEKELTSFVFDTLKERFDNVLINPNEELLHRYFSNDMIVIKPLITRTPRGKDRNIAGLEKILVDLVADKTIGGFIEKNELSNIYSDMTSRYFIDKAAVLSYAKRRNVAEKILELQK